ncbi:MAG: universal stress protein [Candidatus Krumholzibacteria bacterium]|nr:universal stress protein [Candidatus Krumholzibacteria bacterium]
MKKILFCTQLGPNSTLVFRHAFAIASAFGAKITVLHVREVLTQEQEGMVEGYAGKGTLHDVTEREEHQAMDDMRSRIEEFFTAEVGETDWRKHVEKIILLKGDAKEEIVRHIDSVQADLVVMGAHRYSLIDLLLGTTPQRVIAKSKIPVLVVPVFSGDDR